MPLTIEDFSYISFAAAAAGVFGTILASIALARTQEHHCMGGEPGPAGAVGPRGLTGERGPIGPQGLPGKDAVVEPKRPRGRPRKVKTQSKKPRDKQG